MSKHEWDSAGERCVKCGAKDWMGGECKPLGSQAHDQGLIVDTIDVNCPCGNMALTERQDSDPVDAVKIIMACPDCSDKSGGSIEPFYYDKNGKIIDLVSVGRL